MKLRHRPSRLFNLLSTLVLTLAICGAPQALAYERIDLPWPCGSAKWGSDPTFGFMQISFPTAFTRAAVREPGQRINAVGGQSLDLNGWGVYGDNTPTKNRNEIWKTSGLGPSVSGLTSNRYSLCKIKESDVMFPTTAQNNWHHGEPEDYGDNYWQTTDTGSRKYLRHTALHELLHASGFNHEDNDYSFTNYGQRPWGHRGDGYQAEPLPDDRQGLRHSYGNGGSELDVGVLNTHVIPTSSIGLGFINCSPSAGTGFAPTWDLAGSCGNDFSKELCPGDRVYTAYMVVNYSTQAVHTYQRLYFSTGSWLSQDDVPSSSVHQHSINAGSERHRNHSFFVPNLPAGTYWPIVEVTTGHNEESTWNNWIPLPDKITIPDDCP